MKKSIVSMTLLFSLHSVESSPIKISEQCYQQWQDMSEDAAKLKYYMQGVFSGLGEQQVDVKPSEILKFLRDNNQSNMNEGTQLKYMPASGYLYIFLKEKDYDTFDKEFKEKYDETQDLQQTWQWFNDHFYGKLKMDIEAACKNMIEKDAAKIALAEQGIHVQGRTLILDGDRLSGEHVDQEKIGEALRTVYGK